MSGLIDKKAGVFNNAQRYSVTNILDEDLNFTWGGNPFSIPKGKTVSLPQYLANTVLDQMVDKILMGEMKAEEEAFYEKNPNVEINKHRSPNLLNNPIKRKELEDKICITLALEKGSTEAQLLAMQIKEELERDLSAQPSTEPPSIPVSAVGSFSSKSMEEFSELGKEEAPKKPIKVKILK